MKKLALTIAIVLGMGMTTFAQDVEVYDRAGLFGKAPGIFRGSETGEEDPLFGLPSEHGLENDVDTPLGSGIALLAGLGAAYMVAKKRREE